MQSRGTAIRVSAVPRAAWGAVLLCAPDRLLCLGPRPRERTAFVARVLGTRQLVQAAVTAAVPGRRTATAGAVVDALHAIGNVALSVAAPRWRRAALVDAFIASAFAAFGWRFRSSTERSR